MAVVSTGLDRLLIEGPQVAGLAPRSRVGLLVHPASIDATGRHALELLPRIDSLSVERIFAPEHGVWGHEQDMERVAAAREPWTGCRVVSLYGTDPASLRPAAAELIGLDAILCDLQDVGSRYYTFVYTMAHVMEAARESGLPVVVLDRPNPLGGIAVEGPVLEPAFASFVGRYALPVRHGMTVGELAGLFNEEFGIGCDLRVVKMAGWRRGMDFVATGLPWVPPSPNMPSVATAQVYPGGCLVEGTNLSEGRGTTTPFEQIGAPWLDARALAEAMREARLPGALFRAASFRPMFHKHAGQGCQGVQVLVSDPGTFRPFRTYLELLRQAWRQAPDRFAWRAETYEFESDRLAIDLLFGRADLRPRIEAGASLDDLEAEWGEGLERFAPLRKERLLYPVGASD